jgi:hypothetical protein
MNVIGSKTSFDVVLVRSSTHWNICIYGYSVPGPHPTAQLPSNTIRSRSTAYSTVTIQHNPFQAHSLQYSYHPTQSIPDPQPTAQLPSNTIRSRLTACSTVTIQHNPFQAHSLQHSYHPTQSIPDPQPTAQLPSKKSVPDPQPTAQLPSKIISSRPTPYSTVTKI